MPALVLVTLAVLGAAQPRAPGNRPGGLWKLSPFGERVKTVVVAGVGQAIEGLCEGNNTDWRGVLPRFIARSLEGRAQVLLWDTKQWARRANRRRDPCRLCLPGGLGPDEVECSEYFRGRSAAGDGPELLLAVGSGPSPRPAMTNAHLLALVAKRWAKARTVHIPVSFDQRVLDNKVAGFGLVLPDEAIPKPLVRDGVTAHFRADCKGTTRENVLVWMARFNEFKGQRRFLEKVDPALLEGYTIEFYSHLELAGPARAEGDRMRRAAQKKGIAIRIHAGDVDMRRKDAICHAKGAIHYALEDANPRAVYEEVQKGLPVFLSLQARVLPELMRQDFVTVTNSSDPSALNLDFAEYMQMLRAADLESAARDKMDQFIQAELQEDVVFGRLAREMGILIERR